MIKIDTSHLGLNVDYSAYQERVEKINKDINEKLGAGNDFLGWADYPFTYDKEEFDRIKDAAKRIREKYDCLVVCGIGGSYLGARAVIEAINGLHGDNKVEIIYFGQTFDPEYISQTLKYLETKNFAINVISKSGTTTETSIGFRLLWQLLAKKVGKEEAQKSIFATTDKEKGALLELCKKYGFERFVLPSDVGGRFSVFTAVGLLPIAAAGVDIDLLMEGAKKARVDFDNTRISRNPCYQYAILRNYLYTQEKKSVEMLVTYQPKLVQLGEWWKQLYGESEGKGKTGLLPDSATFSTDLHSLGQFIQDGSPILFETIITIDKALDDVLIPHDSDNLDGLNYLEGKDLNFVCKKAEEGTIAAHVEEGGVPNIVIHVDQMDAFNLGYLLYFFMRACAMSAYLNGVNPFNQPGVEVYKKNMFHLLGKPGY